MNERQDLIVRLFEFPYDEYYEEEVCTDIREYLQNQCSRGVPEEIDYLMYDIDTDCVPTPYLVFMLRYTFPIAYEHLYQWKDFLERSVQSSIRRGEDHKNIFGGMLSGEEVTFVTTPYILKMLGLWMPGRM